MNTRKALTNAGRRHNKQIAAMLAMGVKLEIKSRRVRNALWCAYTDDPDRISWTINLLLGRNPKFRTVDYWWRQKLY